MNARVRRAREATPTKAATDGQGMSEKPLAAIASLRDILVLSERGRAALRLSGSEASGAVAAPLPSSSRTAERLPDGSSADDHIVRLLAIANGKRVPVRARRKAYDPASASAHYSPATRRARRGRGAA